MLDVYLGIWSSPKPYKIGIIFILILQTRKLTPSGGHRDNEEKLSDLT